MSCRLPEGYDAEEIMETYLNTVMPLHKDFVYFDDVVNMMCLCDPKMTTRQIRVYTVLLKKVMRFCLVKKNLSVSFLGDGNLSLKRKDLRVRLQKNEDLTKQK